MKHQSRLTRAILASFGIVAIAALAACGGGGNPQAQATPANMSMPTSAATAQLPPGQEPTTAADVHAWAASSVHVGNRVRGGVARSGRG